ncbi:Hemolysin-type calcium-binding repeat-containing protein [Roseivivax marinus]|uniref:calcium-binding protein n=1 Tax=Roseivivax marinus TaxID=1379903 RepID=UPI0008C1871F|nr:calcium-binding protein [Roseivivax marinus]SEL91984.1 Hemolysin-type calcium-binding repeat-containing protein [Roseivivax marinus]
MANITLPVDTGATGTAAADIFNVPFGAATVDGAAGVDIVNILDENGLISIPAGFTVEGAFNGGVYTVTAGDLTLQNFEVGNVANGTLTSTATTAAPNYLQLGDVAVGDLLTQSGDTIRVADASDVMAWTGSQLITLNEDFTISSVNGVEAEESFELDGLGTVALVNSDQSLDFTAFESFLGTLGWGNRAVVELDVEFENDDDTVSFTETFSVTVEGGATEGADFFNTSNTEDDDSDGDFLNGLGGDDVVLGDEGDDFIYGGAGNDEIYAGAKDAAGVVNEDAGNDEFAGGSGDDTIAGGEGDDLLIGDDYAAVSGGEFNAQGNGADIIFGGDGDDDIYTGSLNGITHTGNGDDEAYGGAGEDEIFGDNGDDTLGGGDGDDDILGGGGDDEIYGGQDDGDDDIEGGNGDDLIFGGAGDDDLEGGNDDDTIFNGAGDDEVAGGSGQDTIWGGAGDDLLAGDGDEDTFAFVAGNGADTISDFDASEDILDLSNVAGINADNIGDFAAEVDNELVIYYTDEDSVTLQNVGLDDLDNVNFTFG